MELDTQYWNELKGCIGVYGSWNLHYLHSFYEGNVSLSYEIIVVKEGRMIIGYQLMLRFKFGWELLLKDIKDVSKALNLLKKGFELTERSYE